METITHNFTEESALLQIFGNDISKKYKIQFTNDSNELIYETIIFQNCWASTSVKATNIKVYNEEDILIYDKSWNFKDAMNFNKTSIDYMGSFNPKDLFIDIRDNIKNPFAIISPHAGYYFSGKIAAKSFSVIDKDKKYDNIFILSSSHTASYAGATLCSNEYYNTPFGLMTINNELCLKLSEDILFNFNNDHFKNDHTINMILPFIQERIKPGYKIIPIMIGDSDLNNLKNISNVLKPYLKGNNLFIISSDFSHYPNYYDAIEIDDQTKDAILSNNSEKFLNVVHNNNKPNLSTRMCGWSSYLILLYMIENKDIKINVEEYKNSGDIIDDKNSNVVGYYAINFCDSETNLSISDKKILIDIARQTIKEKLYNNITYEPVKPESDILNSYRGAFVTLTLNDNLKGCIGSFSPNYELYKVVRDVTLQSAFADGRFTPVIKEEFDLLKIEISVLTPFKKVDNPLNEIKLGKHGIYISKNNRSGTFLPQVAEQTGWSLEEYLGHCSRDKAGLEWNEWQTASVYTYEAEVFNEDELVDMKEALYYNSLPEKIVECVLCPHNCKLKNDHYGICLSRKNIGGKLYATSFGNLACVAIDPIEKKPFREFMSGTLTYSISAGGCNFKCLNCQNYGISQETPKDVLQHKLTPEDIVNDAIKNKCPSIAYTYTEPTTFYEMMIDTAKLAQQNGLKNVMVSNGYINEEPLRELCKYVDAFNIDLKSFSNDIYKRLNKGSLEPVLQTLKIIKELDKWLEITFLIIPGWTDNLDMVKEMFDWLFNNGFEKYPIHFIGFFPTYKMLDVPYTSIELVNKCKEIAINCGMKNIKI